MTRTENRKKSRASRVIPNILIGVLAAVGVALVLYPTVADRVNRAKNGGVIENYERDVRSSGDDVNAEMLSAAAEFNADLALNTPYIGRLTVEKQREYENLLNPSGNGVMGYLEVPKAEIYLAVYHGTEENVLRSGVGHLEASSLPVPGESTHTVLTGHSGLPSARLFTDLDRLVPGDTFTLHILSETLTYRVIRSERVRPEELETMRIERGRELCTLVTCSPYGVNTHRLAVTGERVPTPEQPAERPPSVKCGLKSTWNRRYLFFPSVVFALSVAAVIIIRRNVHRKKSSRRKEEETV